jgi:hypothetical protein
VKRNIRAGIIGTQVAEAVSAKHHPHKSVRLPLHATHITRKIHSGVLESNRFCHPLIA